MKRIHSVVMASSLALSWLAAHPSVLRADASPGESFDVAAVDAIAQEALKGWQAPGMAVAIVQNDRAIYLKGFGRRNINKDDPVTPDTVFAVGSTTKAFTATAMAMLVDEGKMAWDDPVRKHIESFKLSDPLADANVTLRDLVTHRTGVAPSDLLWYNSPWSREEILRRLAHVKMHHSFRSTYEYNNIMYMAAGYAVGKAAHGTWEEFVQKRIFDPLGMTGANVSVKAAQKARDHASPHSLTAGELEAIPWRFIDNIGPAGSINAGARDMAKWLRLQLHEGTFENKKLLSAARLRETHEPQVVIPFGGWGFFFPDTVQLSYALGWVVQDYHGQRLLWHSGGIDGFTAQVALLPQKKFGVVILINLGKVEAMRMAVCNDILDLALGQPKKEWVKKLAPPQSGTSEKKTPTGDKQAAKSKRSKPSRELAAYTGAYEEAAYGTAKISLEKDALWLQWSNFNLKLEHVHFDTFSTGDLHWDVIFALNQDGDVEQMKIPRLADFKKAKGKSLDQGEPYGDITGLKVAKPEDKEDVKGIPAPKDAVVLFDGKDLDNWERRNGEGKPNWKLLEGGIMEVVRGSDIITKKKFEGHFKLHVEFRVPYVPQAKGQARGNSGVYVQGRYEVQILDSYGLESKNNDCGAIYEVAAPRVNACKAPTVWQSYDIEFSAPKCENGKKVAPARMTVHHNGIKIHDDVKINADNTRAGMAGDPCQPGPILLQDHGNPVQFRNIWLLPLD